MTAFIRVRVYDDGSIRLRMELRGHELEQELSVFEAERLAENLASALQDRERILEEAADEKREIGFVEASPE